MNTLPPHDVEAERAVLGACMLSREAYAQARELLSDDDWYRPAHEKVWTAINTVQARGEAIDAITVAAQLVRVGDMSRAGGHSYLVDLLASTHTATSTPHHARIISEHAVRRRLGDAANHIAQYALTPEMDLADVLKQSEAELSVVAGMRFTDGQIPGLSTWHDFITEHAGKPGSWIVPGFIARKDVWMVLAAPGAGKTTMSRQICWAAACGIHPFKPAVTYPPVRTLLVDLENDEGMAADESVNFYGRFNSLGAGVGDRGWVWSRPQGINLRKAADAHLLDQVIGRVKPDIVALGSLYKSFIRSGDWDQAAGEAREVFDYLRAKHQVAFWLEHHMPKAQDGGRKHTPFGSSVWEWWTSHGRVLEKTVDLPRAPYSFVASFRGDRGVRETPVGFTRGRLAWEAVWDVDQLRYLTESAGK